MERKKSKQTKKTKQTNKSQQKKSFYIGREQKKTKVRIIGDSWTLFATKEEKKERKKLEKKELNEILIKNRIIRDIRTLFE